MTNKQQAVSDALKQAALDLHEAAGRFACIGKLNAQACSELTRGAARRADEAIEAFAASHPLEQQQAVSGDVVERVARAFCEQDGYDPEYLEPGDDPYQERDGMPSPCIDGYNRKDEPCHFMWRRYDPAARAALAASGMGRMREALEQIVHTYEGRGRYTTGEGHAECVEIARTALQEDAHD